MRGVGFESIRKTAVSVLDSSARPLPDPVSRQNPKVVFPRYAQTFIMTLCRRSCRPDWVAMAPWWLRRFFMVGTLNGVKPLRISIVRISIVWAALATDETTAF